MSNTLKIPSSRNGDTRYDGTLYGGRTSSQQSIYDYPEHLNPFYEDENHKRIRFWNIVGGGKNKHKNGSTNSRRGSFSLTGLKEMWAFKSLRLSKKRSSNLGINKTSESPPPIRRITDNNYENHYGTYDPRMRHTVGNNMTTTINNNFLRNVPYRSSLQDMRSMHNIEYNNNNNSNNNNNNSMTTMTTTTTNNGLGFERNNRYRNTIQTTQRRSGGGLSSSSSPKVPPRRYVYGGSMTPQPRLRSNDLDDDYSGISRGSSQISITSKNPFEEDDNDTDDVVVDKLTGSDEKRKRHIRKKRRAPPPPIPIPKIIDEEPQTNTSPDCCHDQQHNKTNDESLEIKNLADEIENFVKSTNNSPDKENLKNNNYSREIDDTTSQKDVVVRVTNENHQENSSESLKEEEKKTTFTIVTTFVDQDLSPIIKCDDNQKEIDSTETTEIQQENIESEKTIKETINENKISTLNSDVEKDTDIEISRIEDHDNLNLNDNEIQKIPEHPVVDELNNDDQKTIELKITESVEDLSERSQKSETSNEVVSEFEYVPLNISSNLEENEKQDEVEIKEINVNFNDKILYEDHTILRHDQNEEKDKQTTETTTTTTNTSNRRRSVREIIEAINRSQKLLNINNQQNVSENHDDNKDGCEQKSTIDSDTNVKNNNVVIKAPPRKKYDLIKDHQLKQQQNDNNNSIVMDDNSIQTEDNDNSYYDGGNNENDNNCVIFKKCEINNKKTINRETSPISSNLDWNPVPKPKRTKKLTIELQKCDDQNEMKSE